MDEAAWLSAVRPDLLWPYLGERISTRKRWLFHCACCRRHWELFTDPNSRLAVETAERRADGSASAEEIAAATRAALAAGRRAGSARWKAEEGRGPGRRDVWWQEEQAVRTAAEREAAAWLAWDLVRRDNVFFAAPHEFGLEIAAERGAEPGERAAQADLLRELVGNPFRPVALDPAWLDWNDRTVPKLAQVIYDDRAFNRLPLLADALEDAGCGDAAILRHCREPGEHVRGCWVVDLLLGKS